MRVVVLGSGLLGWNLARVLAAEGVPHVALSRADVDLAAPDVAARVRGVLRAGDVLVNAAALTNVDACEDREEEAMRVNGEAPGALARAAADAGARLVHVSTDVVLDPTNVYARSKVLGERRVREEVGGDALIFRISTTFGPHPTRSDFVQWTLGKLAAGKPFPVLEDMVSSPGYAPDAALAILALARADAAGVRQFANHPGISRLEFARLVQDVWGLPGTITPARMADFGGFKAPRPRDTSMASTVAPEHEPMPLTACLEHYRRDATRPPLVA